MVAYVLTLFCVLNIYLRWQIFRTESHIVRLTLIAQSVVIGFVVKYSSTFIIICSLVYHLLSPVLLRSQRKFHISVAAVSCVCWQVDLWRKLILRGRYSYSTDACNRGRGGPGQICPHLLVCRTIAKELLMSWDWNPYTRWIMCHKPVSPRKAAHVLD